MNHYNVSAIVLKRIDYGEADRILTILTDKLGKISAIAKGVRKINSKLAGGIEPLALNQLSLISGKSDMYTVTSARTQQSFRNILTDYDSTQTAFMIMKKANQIELTDSEDWLIEVLVTSFSALDAGVDQDLVKLWVYLNMLNSLGHFPDLNTDDNGAKLSETSTYRLDYMHGFLINSGPLTSSHIKLWRLCDQYSPMQLSKVQGAAQAARESWTQAERALEYSLS